jgi:SecD/SecF fusion protein
LTIIGYSLNDTIVIFDRIREVKGKSPRLTAEMINLAVNQCFARTLLTSFTALISVFVLYVVGGEGIHAFAFALLVGFISGVYSTIYIANPVLLWLAQRADAAAARPGSKAA